MVGCFHRVVDGDGLGLTAGSKPGSGTDVVVGQDKKDGAHLAVKIIEGRAEAVGVPVEKDS
jgi:hypothetical protein